MGRAGRICALALAAALAASAIGCRASTRTYPFELGLVWQACVGETVIWRSIGGMDEDNHTITSTRYSLDGEIRHSLEVTSLMRLFGKPRTRIYVRIEQTQPEKKRFTGEETHFLDRIGDILQQTPALLGP